MGGERANYVCLLEPASPRIGVVISWAVDSRIFTTVGFTVACAFLCLVVEPSVAGERCKEKHVMLCHFDIDAS